MLWSKTEKQSQPSKLEQYGLPLDSPVLNRIDKANWSQARKQLFTEFFEQLKPNQQKEYEKKRFVQWAKSSSFEKMLQQQKENALNQFRIASLVIVMMATVVLHFIFSIFIGYYLINFSIDALVASACLAFLYVNLKNKYRLLSAFGVLKDYRLMDLLSVILCFLVELLVFGFGLDLSIVILFGTYWLEKRKFSFFLENTYSKQIAS